MRGALSAAAHRGDFSAKMVQRQKDLTAPLTCKACVEARAEENGDRRGDAQPGGERRAAGHKVLEVRRHRRGDLFENTAAKGGGWQGAMAPALPRQRGTTARAATPSLSRCVAVCACVHARAHTGEGALAASGCAGMVA